ncbi:MAG: hypothetical protein P4L69_05460 [Desulfosporosinus sp.]|nr:hypothetical protein [Desulfosporosinus sp.]
MDTQAITEVVQALSDARDTVNIASKRLATLGGNVSIDKTWLLQKTSDIEKLATEIIVACCCACAETPTKKKTCGPSSNTKGPLVCPGAPERHKAHPRFRQYAYHIPPLVFEDMTDPIED